VILLSFSKDWYGTVLPLIPEGFTLGHYDDALSHDLTVGSIGNSLLYASLATLVDVILGVAIAYIVVRTTLPGRQLLDSLAMLPLAVPGLVLAFGYLAMSREGRSFDFLVYPDAAMQGVQALQGESGIIANIISLPKRIMGTVFGWIIKDGNPVILLVIAYAIRRLPYVVRSAVAGLQQTNVSLEEAAQNLGCTAFGALRKITIPIIVANLIAGALLAFAFAMLEVSDSLILAERAEHYPITKAIYSLFSSLGNGPYLASALGVWSMLFLGTTIIGAGLILGKKLGALFRV